MKTLGLFASAFLSLSLSAVAAAQGARAPEPTDRAAPASDAIPEGYISDSAWHRVRVDAGNPLLGELLLSGGTRKVEDYGTFSIVHIATRTPRELDAFVARGAQVVDEHVLVGFNGFLLDGSDARATERVLATIPVELRAPSGPFVEGERRMRLVQFDGPVRDEWLTSVEQTGAFVVSYAPNNAYVVTVDAQANAALEALRAKPWVLSLAEYEPVFKLRRELQPGAIDPSAFYRVIVQAVADKRGMDTVAALRLRAVEEHGDLAPVLNYINVELTMDGANVLDAARDSGVFAIEPKLEARLFDEAQGQIMAGNVNAAGTQPSGAGYLAWLQSQGFPGANPFSFSVDVHDDGVDRGSTTDVNTEFKVDGLAAGASRVAFNNNYTTDATGDGVGGHGNINASIIGGYNVLTGAAFEDASGYNYGLGIAPWVRIGNSKVFANSGAGQFNQPTLTRMANAYNAGARISSNSWGYTTGNAYNSDSQAHDAAVRDAVSGTAGNQELSIIFAAGNGGSIAGSVNPPGTAKNVLTVGASENFRQTGTDGCGIANTGANNALDIIAFSSRGPTGDSRKKPEIMAPGTHVQGAASRATGYNGSGVCNQYWPAGQTLYAWSSGTSHSTPAVAGFAALVRQDYLNNGLAVPSPALVKAEIVAGAKYMTGVGANDALFSNNQGFGLTNMARSFDAAARMRVDQTQVLGATGATYVATGTISSTTAPLRVALVWTDAPGPTTGNAFVNNLDLEVTLNGTLYRGNVFTGGSSTSGGVADTRNNTECVFLPAGTTGSFSITVRATNIAGDGVPGNADTTDQDFALLVYNGSASAPTPNFSLSAAPATSTITAGASTSYTIASSALNGFTGSVSLAATPAISGVTYTFATNPVTAGASSVLNVATTAAATPGTYTVTVTGTSGTLSRTTTMQLVINAPPVPSFTLAATPASNTVTVGGSATYTVTSTATGGFTGNVTLAASPAIAGVTYSFGTNPVAATGSSTFTCATASTAVAGTYTITLTGTSGTLTRTTTVTLVIAPPAGTNPVKTYTAAAALAIPDNNTTGVTSTINVPLGLTVTSVSVSTVIPHTHKGDLIVTLTAPDNTSRILHNRTGAATDNVTTTFSIVTAANQALTFFNGKNTLGAWRLKVTDNAAGDVGTLSSWSITFNGERALTANTAIPDNNTTGITSTQTFTQTGTVAAVKIRCNVTHTFKGDLEIALIAPDNTTVLLHNRTGAATDNVNTVFPDLTAPAQALSAFTGKSINGAWKLRVRDLSASDTGSLVNWTLSLQAQ